MKSAQKQNNWVFIEIWLDIGLNPPYVLQLIHDKDGQYQIIDPQENYKILYSTQSYEEARYWLVEDEYQIVDGRVANE